MQSMKKTVVVLGMHRSGTSLVSGILKNLGVNMGDVLLGSNFGNPTGHFEDLEFLKLNNAILKSACGGWDNPPSPEKIASQKKIFSDRIKLLVERRNSNSEIWGWKDPRTCLTIDLFLEHLINPHIIICQRTHKEILKSLHLRGKIQYKDGIELVDYYEERISEFLQKHSSLRCLFLNHAENLKNPDSMIASIIEFLETSPDKKSISNARKLFSSKQKIWMKRMSILLKQMFIAPRTFSLKLKQRFSKHTY